MLSTIANYIYSYFVETPAEGDNSNPDQIKSYEIIENITPQVATPKNVTTAPTQPVRTPKSKKKKLPVEFVRKVKN